MTAAEEEPESRGMAGLAALVVDHIDVEVELSDVWGIEAADLEFNNEVRFPPDRRGIDNEDRDAREAEEVRPGVP